MVKSLGLSTSKVTAWKKGGIPKQETLYKLAEVLNVSVDCFFRDQTEKEKKQIAKVVQIANQILQLISPSNLGRWGRRLLF